MTITPKYYKDDFPMLWRELDCKCREQLPSEVDFEIKFHTGSPAFTYTASRRHGMYQNCREDKDGRLWIIFNSHGLPPGNLQFEVHYYIPNTMYPDGVEDIHRKGTTNVVLTKEDTGCPSPVEVEVLAPYIKGDPGKSLTYADLTEADKKDLASHIDTSGIKGAPGASAYETWLKQGNTGTEADFLNWLRAPAGSCDVNFVPLTDEEIDAAVQEVLDADKPQTPDNPE